MEGIPAGPRPRTGPVKGLIMRQERDFASAVLNTTGALVAVLDPQGRITRFNRACEEVTGYSAAEVQGRVFWEFLVPPEDLPVVRETWEHLKAGDFPNGHENHWLARDGSRRLIAWSNTALVDEAGEVRHIIATGLDITERKRAEEALREGEERRKVAVVVQAERRRLNDVLEMLPAYVMLLSPDYHVRFANCFFEDRFGRSNGKRCYEHLFHRTEPCETCKVLKTNAPHRWEWTGPDGRNYDAHAFLFTDADGSPLIMEMGIDVTERKRAETALKEANETLERCVAERTAGLGKSEERFRLLSSTAGRLLATEDPQGLVNELCCEVMAHLDCQAFFNFLVDEPAGRLRLNACAGIPPDEVRKIEWLDYGAAVVCGCVARDGRRIIAEDIQHTPDPRTELVKGYGIQAYCCYPLTAQGRLIGTLSFAAKTRARFTAAEVEVMRIVADQVAAAMQRIQSQQKLRASEETARQRAEQLKSLNDTLEERVIARTAEAMQRTEQLRALTSELTQAEHRERRRLAKMLHDHLQQLLVGAKFNVGALRGRVRTKMQQQTVQQLSEILDEAIKAARSLTAELSPPVLHEKGLAAGLEWLARQMREKHGLAVDVEADADAEPKTEQVRLFLFDAMRELLFNVLKHARVDRARTTMRRLSGGLMAVTVSDEGAGFDVAAIEAAATAGGFGLFSIRERLRYLGGRMEVQSAPGHGSRFTLVAPMLLAVPIGPVPAAAAAERPAAVAAPAPQTGVLFPEGRAIRVLLADDHPVMRQGLMRLLQEHPDIEVVGEAGDGRAAVALAGQLQPDVVLMDVTMPGLNGIEATRLIVGQLPHIYVIGLSMHEEADMADGMRQAGAAAYLTKGGPTEHLIEAIRACRAERPC